MKLHSLRSFINELKDEDLLKTISVEVKSDLEIAEFTDRESKLPGGGNALLFTNVENSEYQVVTNLYGSKYRISKALYCSDISVQAENIKYIFNGLLSPKKSFIDKIGVLGLLSKISRSFPKISSRLPRCREVVDYQPDLNKLPVLKCWPFDGGRFITLPMVHTVDPITGTANCGMYRVQILDGCTTAMHWHKHKTGASHFEKYRSLGQKMPVAIVLGGDPVYAYCATAPLPEGIDEYTLAGFLRGNPVKMVKCLTQKKIYVPADADFVIEGYIDPDEEFVLEGPFGDHTGFYSAADFYPKVHVTCVSHARDAIYPATLVGIPPMEDAYLSYATESLFKYPIKLAFVPELEDLHMPVCGVQHNIVFVKISNLYPGDVEKVKHALWGAGQMMFNKILIITDFDIPLSDYKELGQKLNSDFAPYADVSFDKGVSDVLDHSSREYTYGGKMCIDLTKKDSKSLFFDKEAIKLISLRDFDIADTPITCVDLRFSQKGIPIVFVFVKKTSEFNFENLMQSIIKKNSGLKIAVTVETELENSNIETLFWYAAGNIDPLADCLIINNCLCINATRKTIESDKFNRPWPEPTVSDQSTIASVDQKSSAQVIDSPSMKFKKLSLEKSAVRFTNKK